MVTPCATGMAELVSLQGGVLVTPWHPLREHSSSNCLEWKFPCDLAPTAMYSCNKVYNFVLEEGASTIQIGPYEAVTLGHNLQEPVAEHPNKNNTSNMYRFGILECNYVGLCFVRLASSSGWFNGIKLSWKTSTAFCRTCIEKYPLSS